MIRWDNVRPCRNDALASAAVALERAWENGTAKVRADGELSQEGLGLRYKTLTGDVYDAHLLLWHDDGTADVRLVIPGWGAGFDLHRIKVKQ